MVAIVALRSIAGRTVLRQSATLVTRCRLARFSGFGGWLARSTLTRFLGMLRAPAIVYIDRAARSAEEFQRIFRSTVRVDGRRG